MSPTHPDPDPELIVAHVPYVRALARELVFDADLAKDVEQEVLLAALENAPRERRSIRAWLATVVRNVAYKAFRARSRREDRERQAAREGVPTPEEILAREDLRRALVEHVLALEEPLRDVLVLRFFEDLPPREVARRLGIPIETARTRQKRAMQLLRERLERENGRGRGAWCLALVTGLKVEPPSLLTAAVTVVGASVAGVVAMGVSKKLGIAAVVLALASTAWIVIESAEPVAPSARPVSAAPEPGELRTPAAAEPARAPSEEGRTAVAAPPAPEPEPVIAATTGSVLLTVRWSDGTHAAGVTARVYQNANDFYADAFDVTTGADGTYLLEALAPGSFLIGIDRGPQDQGVVVAGERTEMEITIQSGFDVSGRVVERGGRTVAGAEILLDRGGGGWNGFVVARSDSEGRFAIRSVEEGIAWISARAAFHAPSAQRELVGGSTAFEKIELVLEAQGAALDGVVLGSDGEPLPFARVLVGPEHAYEQARFDDGGRGRERCAQATTCDARGRFTIAGVPLGKLPVQARGAGHAPWTGEVETVDQRPAFLEIRLARCTTLTGRVIDSSGAPVEHASILGNGNYGFAARTSRTAADGTFTMQDLPVGEFEVRVEKDGFMGAKATLVGAPGAELTWNPVLGSGLSIRGRLEMPDTDFSQWYVQVESHDMRKSPLNTWVNPSADGAFVINGCGDVEHDLAIHPPESSWIFPTAERKDVRPGDGELVIAIDPRSLPSCRLRGRIVDEHGQPIPSAEYLVSREGQNTAPILTADADGSFDTGPYPPGKYAIGVRAAGFANFASTYIEVAAGATWDFGELVVQRGGTLVVRLARDPSLAQAQLSIHAVRPGSDESCWLFVRGDEAASETISPGEYEVTLSGIDPADAIAPQTARVTVRAGEQASIEMRVVRAP